MRYLSDLKVLDAALDFSVVLFSELNTESKNGPYVVMMGLYASMIEQSKAFSTLLHSKSFIATQPIARIIMEIYVDIKNIEFHGNYVNYVMAEYYDRQKELSKNKCAEKANRRKRNDAFSLYMPNQIYKSFSIADKFTLVSLKDDYKRIYCVLSGHTHSGFASLLNRVSSADEVQKLSSQTLFKVEPSAIEAAAIPLISYYLMNASEIISKGHHIDAYHATRDFHCELINFNKSE